MGIKSFQGKQIGKEFLSEDINVADYMTRDMVTFRANQHILEVMEQLIKHKVSGGPVVNAKQELVGIISEGDCIKQLSTSRYYNQPLDQINLADYMTTTVETVSPDMHLFDVAEKFLRLRKRRFPVCENGKLVGLISQKNVLKAALSLHGNTW